MLTRHCRPPENPRSNHQPTNCSSQLSTAPYTSKTPSTAGSNPILKRENAIDNPSYEKVVKDFNKSATLPPQSQYEYQHRIRRDSAPTDRVSSPDFPPPPPELQAAPDDELSPSQDPSVEAAVPTYEVVDLKTADESSRKENEERKQQRRRDEDRRKRESEREERRRREEDREERHKRDEERRKRDEEKEERRKRDEERRKRSPKKVLFSMKIKEKAIPQISSCTVSTEFFHYFLFIYAYVTVISLA